VALVCKEPRTVLLGVSDDAESWETEKAQSTPGLPSVSCTEESL